MAGIPASAADRRIGARIRFTRTAAGITQAEAGRAVGVSLQQFRKYETGKNRISASAIQTLADLFDIPVADLFDPRMPRLREVEDCRSYAPGLAVAEVA